MSRIEQALRRARDQAIARATDARADSDTRVSLDSGSGIKGSIPSKVPISHKVEPDKEWLRQERIIAASDNDVRVAPYRQLRTKLLKTMTDNQWSTLAITSANEGAGKSLTSVNLAISLSRVSASSILLVDLDLLTPTIYKKFGFSPEFGLIDYLEGNVPIDHILFGVGLEGLVILAGRPAGREASELLASSRMKQLMDALCAQGKRSLTIFDLPPLLRNDDAIMFAPYADATLLIIEDGVTTIDDLKKCETLLQKANLIGTVLNKARLE